MIDGTEEQERAEVVAVARSFIGTPYHHQARVKGPNGGIDCGTLLAEAYAEVGLMPVNLPIPQYSPQWHLHRSEERIIPLLSQWAFEADYYPPKPGDVVLWKMFKCFAHCAIAIDWPIVVHAHRDAGAVVFEDVEKYPMLHTYLERGPDHGKPRPMKIFTFWPKELRP